MSTSDRQTLTARRRMAHGLEEVINTQRWMADGSCAGLPPEEADRLFFSAGPVSTDADALCGGCPVRRECAQFAVDGGEEYGVWGGFRAAEFAGVDAVSA